MTGTRPEKGRRRLRALLALSISSLASVAGAELWCRAQYGIPIREKLPIMPVVADARRGYAMIPGTEHYTYERPVRVNGLGLRGAEMPEKQEGETRVLCLGDSTVYGQGLTEDATIPVLLERELARNLQPPRTVRAVNGGLRGYGTEQEIALLEELGPRIRPDLVVLFWYPNDLEKHDIVEMNARLERQGRVEYDTQSRLEGSTLLVWQAKEYLRRSAFVMQVHDILTSLTTKRLSPEEIEGGFERLDRSLGDLARAAESQGARLLVVAIPTAGMVAAGEEGRDIPRRVGKLVEKHGIACADVFEPLSELHRELGHLPLLPYDWHYTGEANLAMAKRLAEVLRERFPSLL
ncbi:MAG: SGNH/GDSL hydrolase family protein [Planctomycetota bacterium]